DTITPLLDHLRKEKTTPDTATLRSNSLAPGQLLRDRETDNYSYQHRPCFGSSTTSKLIRQVIEKHPIKARSTRNGMLVRLAGECFHKFGWQLSERVIREHFERNKENTTTPLGEHMREFSAAWQSFRE